MKKRYLKIIIWSLSIALFLCLVCFAVIYYGKNKCHEVQISVDAPKDATFISEQDVKNYIIRAGDSLIGTELRKINIASIENIINENPFVLKSKVYSTLSGTIKIEIMQRTPIVRVQNMFNQSYYISQDGCLMPIVEGKTARVIVANGYIPDLYMNSLKLDIDSARIETDSVRLNKNLVKVYAAAHYINHDPFWKAQIQQLFISRNGDILMIPLVGDQIINLGDAKNIPEKLQKFRIFTTKPEFLSSWDKYDTINIKFKGQIVCSKKIIIKNK